MTDVSRALVEAGSDDPHVALTAIRQLREVVEASEPDAVFRARAAGLSWEEIASLLGRVRSSVWERYHDLSR